MPIELFLPSNEFKIPDSLILLLSWSPPTVLLFTSTLIAVFSSIYFLITLFYTGCVEVSDSSESTITPLISIFSIASSTYCLIILF